MKSVALEEEDVDRWRKELNLIQESKWEYKE